MGRASGRTLVLQTVNHARSIIVSSLSMPLRLLSEVENLLHHVGRPMKLARNDPFAAAAGHETTAARQPRNAAQPLRRLRPPHLDTGHLACGSIGGFLVSIGSGCAHRDRYKAASHAISPVAILLAARHLMWSQQSTRITGIIHRLSRREAILECGRFKLE